MSSLLYNSPSWDFKLINDLHEECYKIANEELRLNVFPSTYEVISSDQMLELYSTVAMPVNYNHWSFGKTYSIEERNYRSGRNGLAYEITSNTNPNIVYLMEENTACLQNVVIAHCLGHNHFFKNNYLFKMWTSPDAIIDYLVFAKHYIEECEEKYGIEAVEKILDSAHALKYHAVDKYKRPTPLSADMEKKKLQEREEYLQSQVNILWNKTVPKSTRSKKKIHPQEPQENILKFIEKNSPTLEPWQREILRIVRKTSQYFYPQMQTKVMNEGMATWTHNYIMNRLYDKGLIDSGAMIEYIKANSGVIYQPTYEKRGYSGFNPYALGFAIFKDIQRICQNPTEEDKEWFPELIGKDFVEVIKDAVENYRDESFILQFLSPKVMRDFSMFRINDHDEDFYNVDSISDDTGYRDIRRVLANRYKIGNIVPNIQIVNSNLDNNRILEIHHYATDDKKLVKEDTMECMKHIKRLWGFDPILISYDSSGKEIDSFTF